MHEGPSRIENQNKNRNILWISNAISKLINPIENQNPNRPTAPVTRDVMHACSSMQLTEVARTSVNLFSATCFCILGIISGHSHQWQPVTTQREREKEKKPQIVQINAHQNRIRVSCHVMANGSQAYRISSHSNKNGWNMFPNLGSVASTRVQLVALHTK